MSLARAVSRKDLNIQTGALIDGIWRAAGIIQDLRTNPALNKFIPAGTAITWVSLENLKPLDVHVHPIESFVAIVRGRAKVRGENELILDEGQVVRIPRGRWHGFESVDQNGFWGIAWQFAETHLFETNSRRLVFFPGESIAESIEPCEKKDSTLETLYSAEAPWLSFNSAKVAKNQSIIFEPQHRELWLLGNGRLQVDLPDQRLDLDEGDVLMIDPRTDLKISVCGLKPAMLSRFTFA